jgi:hypothetical protein
MPKVVDRSKWILLPDGQNQTGWLENSGATVYGCFRTHWRLPDGTERTWRERVVLDTPSRGVKAAERLLIDKIREFFHREDDGRWLATQGHPGQDLRLAVGESKRGTRPGVESEHGPYQQNVP